MKISGAVVSQISLSVKLQPLFFNFMQKEMKTFVQLKNC